MMGRRRHRHMEWVASSMHMRGVPRKIVIGAVGLFAKTVANFLNNTHVHNSPTLFRLLRSRPPGVPLITVSNHMSTSVPVLIFSPILIGVFFLLAFYTSFFI